jgi:hypothetical protein
VTTETSPTTARKPSRFLAYPGDVTHMVGEVVGPNQLGEFLTAVNASYNEGTDRTTVGFAFTTADDVALALGVGKPAPIIVTAKDKGNR